MVDIPVWDNFSRDDATKAIKAYLVSLAGGATEATLASILVDLDTRYVGGKTSFSEILTASTVITPAAGKYLTVYKLQVVPSPDNSSANPVTIKFTGASNNLFEGYAGGFWEPFSGAVNQALDITLTNAQPVSVTIHYKET